MGLPIELLPGSSIGPCIPGVRLPRALQVGLFTKVAVHEGMRERHALCTPSGLGTNSGASRTHGDVSLRARRLR